MTRDEAAAALEAIGYIPPGVALIVLTLHEDVAADVPHASPRAADDA